MALPLAIVKTTITGAAPEGSFTTGISGRQGIQVVQDWYTYMILAGAGYQVKAGTVTTPIVGKVTITDTGAEMCADAVAGYTMIPVYANLSFRLAAGTLFESAGKSVATVSSAGTAFVPLPLKAGGAAAITTARAMTAGGCTVTAELATTTLRHFSWSQPIAAGAWPTTYDWTPRTPPVLTGPRCFYLQIAGTGTGPSYYAHFDYLEALTASIT